MLSFKVGQFRDGVITQESAAATVAAAVVAAAADDDEDATAGYSWIWFESVVYTIDTS